MAETFDIDYTKIPEHVGIIMDGNGRWAAKRKIPKLAGHEAGIEALKEIVRTSSDMGVKYLTVYAFSTENWRRSKEEVGGIFKLLVYYMQRIIRELHENQVQIHVLGDYSSIPKKAIDSVEYAVELTKNNTGLKLNMALNYGGRDDIVKAVVSAAQDVKDGKLLPEEIDEELISSRLYTAGMPDPDLIIRTSGELRLSNFLLWQSAYSELYFTDALWPDFDKNEYLRAIESFQHRKRNFGGR